MKKLSILIVTLMVIVFLGTVESNAGDIEKRYSRHNDRIGNDREMRDGHLSSRERFKIEHRRDQASRHIYRMKYNDTGRHDRGCYDEDISFRKSAVVVPILLPPFPPPPFIFPGMHIRIFSSR